MQLINAKREARAKRKLNKPEKILSPKRMSSVIIEETDRRRAGEPKSVRVVNEINIAALDHFIIPKKADTNRNTLELL